MANQMLAKAGGVRKPKLTGCFAVAQSTNKLFLDQNPELSDVCFLVGDEREKIYAHRIFLAIESEVFKSMFYGELKETKYEIEIPDLSPVGFRNMIKYFYSKQVEEIDLCEICPTYMAANKYLASSLIEDLTDHIHKSCMDIANVCVIYDQLLKVNIDDSLTDDLKRKIAERCSEAFASDSFEQIDENTLISILKCNTLSIIESDLLRACMRWTDSQVARQGADQVNKRAVFDSIKHLIRFGDLSLSYLSSIPEIEDYLTTEEIGSIFLHLCYQKKPIQIDYRSPRESRSKAGVARIEKGSCFANFNREKRFSIGADKRVRICSIKTFDVYNSESLRVEIYRDNNWTPLDCKIVSCQGSDSVYKIYTIELTQVLEANIRADLRFSFSPPSDSENFFTLTTSTMGLRSDGGEVMFKIESNSGFHCIDSIDFQGPLD